MAIARSGSKSSKNLVLKGIPASPGIAMGPAFLYFEPDLEPEIRPISQKEISAEIQRFRNSVDSVREFLQRRKEEWPVAYGSDLEQMLEIQLSLMQDEEFLSEVEKTIREELLDAASATFLVFKKKAEKLLSSPSEYFRDRAIDIQALKKLLLSHLIGEVRQPAFEEPAIIVAEEIGPADLVRLPREKILGLATNSGGSTSHAAIIARALSVPAVAGLGTATQIVSQGTRLILDGNKGLLIVDPAPEVLKNYRRSKKKLLSYQKKLQRESKLETRTLDGVPVQVAANVEFEEEIQKLHEVHADGIGLFRTEGIFLNRNTLPTEEEQTRIYTRVAQEVAPNPCVIRTIDVGGDKMLRWLMYGGEPNPFLGWRAIRFWLDHPEYFLVQLKAMLRANVAGNVWILLPMISGLEEVYQVKELLRKAQLQLEKEGKPFNPEVSLGIMVEIPSTVILADLFAREVDFFSLGTNDLVQYTLAVDRSNEKVARLYSFYHPAILRMIEQTIAAGKKAGIEVSLCGEMAAEPQAIPILLGAGLRHFSAASLRIPEIKRVIRNLSVSECRDFFVRLKKLKTTREVREAAEEFYAVHLQSQIEIG